jgi:hypothetical protein
VRQQSKFALVKRSALTSMVLIAAAGLSLGQRPSPTSAPSNWQLGPPFELESKPLSSAPARSSSPAAISSSRAPVVQTTSTQPNRDRTVTGKPPYVEGSTWVLTFIKTKATSTDEYLRSIASSLKPFYEEQKKQQLILDYKILTGEASADRDFNVILMVEYPNMAALDSAREKSEAMIDKIIGPTEKRREAAIKRSDTREILASKTMREIRLK